MEETSVKAKDGYAPHIALLAVQVFFGSAPILGKIALAAFPPPAIVGFRVAGAAVSFGLLQKFGGSFKLDKRVHYLYFALFACFGVIFNQLLFFKGLSLTTATNTSLLAVMIPVFAILVSVIIGNDKLTFLKILGTITAGGGVIYLIDPANASFSSATTQGDILIILNSMSYATYVAVSKKLITHYGALKSIAWLFLFASIVNVPVGLFSLTAVEISQVSVSAWLALGATVIFPTILAYYWNAWALARVEPSVVAVYIYLQPLIGTILAIFILGEAWKPRIFTAMILIFTGVFSRYAQAKTRSYLETLIAFILNFNRMDRMNRIGVLFRIYPAYPVHHVKIFPPMTVNLTFPSASKATKSARFPISIEP